jgi:hypothetical protein
MQLRAYVPVLRPLQAAQGQPGQAHGREVYVMENCRSATAEYWIDESGVQHRVLARSRLNYFQPGPKLLRDFVMSRDSGSCLICQSSYNLVIDHIISLKNGGTNHPDNLRCLCSTCNTRKVGLFDASKMHALPHIKAIDWGVWIEGGKIRFAAILPGYSESFSLPKKMAKAMAEAVLKLLSDDDSAQEQSNQQQRNQGF